VSESKKKEGKEYTEYSIEDVLEVGGDMDKCACFLASEAVDQLWEFIENRDTLTSEDVELLGNIHDNLGNFVLYRCPTKAFEGKFDPGKCADEAHAAWEAR